LNLLALVVAPQKTAHRGGFLLPQKTRKDFMFLPFIGIFLLALVLFKLGSLAVWVVILALALKLSIAVIVLLAGLLGWQHVKKQ